MPMERFTTESQCQRCNSMKVKEWNELDEEQQYLVDRLPDFEDLSMSEIRSGRYCTKCWFRQSRASEHFA